MKRYVVIAIALLAASFTAQSQATFTTTLGTGVAIDGRSNSFAWRFTSHYDLTDRWSFGVGTGVSVYEKTLVPVFAYAMYCLGRERRLTPFVATAGGYSFAFSSDARGGVMLNLSAGVRYRLTDGILLLLSAGWEMQRFGHLISRTDTWFHKQFAEHLTRNAIYIRLGVVF